MFAHTFYTLLYVRWAVFAWHFLPLWLLFVLASVDLGDAVLSRLRGLIWRPSIWICCGLLCVVAGFRMHQTAFGLDHARSWCAQAHAAALWEREHTPAGAVFAMKDCGIFGYFSQRTVINLDGLVNELAYQEVLRERRLADYFASEGVDFLVVHALLESGDANVHQRAYGLTGSVRSGEYEMLEFEFVSHKYGTYSDPIRVYRADEVYRDQAARSGNIFVIYCWRSTRSPA